MRQKFVPLDENTWLNLRKPDLTSTMVPALFGLSPYVTTFELYHAKKSGLEIPFDTNSRMEKGKRIEGYAAAEIALKHGWIVTAKPEYIRMPEVRLGSSFDFDAVCPVRGEGLLEIKAVDYFQHRDKWSEDEIPAHIEVQARFQMLLADKQWCAVAAFTNIYDHFLYFFTRDPEFDAGILAAAEKFWADVDAANEPRPDFYRDAAVIAELYKNAGGDLADFTGDVEFETIACRFLREKELADHHKDEADAAKAELHRLLKDEGGGQSDHYRVKAGWTKGRAGTLVTPEMVGTTIGAAKGFRQCLVTALNKGDGDV